MHTYPRVWVAAICVVAAALIFGTAAAGATPPPDCSTRVNDTPGKLLPCITTSDLMNHMQNFWDIALANPGPDGMPSRNAGEPGYLASVNYVKGLMDAAGYKTTVQKYTIDYFAYLSPPTLTESSPTAQTFTVNVDFSTAQSLGTATDATVQPIGGFVLPPTPESSSTSGCTAADFSGFNPGNIALIQRGGCNYGVKVLNAQAAGATGVIIFNEGNPGRTDVPGIGIFDAAGNPFTPTIPVAGVSFDTGMTLNDDYKAGTPAVMTFTIHGIHDPNRTDYNLIADSPGGDKNHTVVVDAHLDAIYGAGMLDNASGSATILDIAQLMKNVSPTNHLRFIWFGGEELGLLGSQHYVGNLSSTERSHIGYDLDADVTATPNYTLGILDPAAGDLFGGDSTLGVFPNRVYKPSLVARDAGVDYLSSQGFHHEFFSPTGTDAFSFNQVGIPASGVLTGQDCCKVQHEVDLFGGELGNFEGNLGSFDGGCVDNPFIWCDNLDNNDFSVMTTMTRDFATMVLRMAFDTKVMSSSGSVVYNKKTAISQETGSRHLPAR
jgi:Zn-dependent M28 family amino/carboxypeptidase